MTKHYSNYFWKEGIPRGVCSVKFPEEADESYKILSDPYFKRISLEKYSKGRFLETIYDSALFDFRHLKLAEQLAWQKTIVKEEESEVICHIRDQNDRLILIEEYFFEQNLCKKCRIISPQEITLATQKIFHTFLNDSFNGITLYDSHSHPIMCKRYEIDLDTQEFTQLLEERWDMSKFTDNLTC